MKYGKIRIDPKVLDKAKGNPDFIPALVAANKMHYATVERWVKDNEVYLTLENNIRLIRKFAGVKEGKNICIELT